MDCMELVVEQVAVGSESILVEGAPLFDRSVVHSTFSQGHFLNVGEPITTRLHVVVVGQSLLPFFLLQPLLQVVFALVDNLGILDEEHVAFLLAYLDVFELFAHLLFEIAPGGF